MIPLAFRLESVCLGNLISFLVDAACSNIIFKRWFAFEIHMGIATLITGNQVQCIVIFIISIISYAVTKNKILFIIYPKMFAWLVIPQYMRPWLRIYSQIYLVTVPIVRITYFSIWESVIRYFTVNNIVYSFRLASVNQTEFNWSILICVE